MQVSLDLWKEEQNLNYILSWPHYGQLQEVFANSRASTRTDVWQESVHATERFHTCQVSEFHIHKEVTDRENNQKKLFHTRLGNPRVF